MERSRLICSLIGYYTGKNPSITAKDLQIQVDNHLLDSTLPILGSEKDDLEILSDLNDETFFSVLSWSNRPMRRYGGVTNKYKKSN